VAYTTKLVLKNEVIL